MLAIEHLRFEILRDAVVRDFSLTLAAGEVNYQDRKSVV